MTKTWYGEFGWKENPLDWRIHSRFIIGLEDQLLKLKTFVGKGKFVVLHGPTGTGKTTLAQHLTKTDNVHHYVYLAGDELAGKTNLDFEKQFLKGWVYKAQSILGLKGPIVVLLDEALAVPDYFMEQLKGAFNSRKVKSIVFIQISPDMSKYPEALKSRVLSGGSQVETKLLSDGELLELLDKRLEGKLNKLFDKKAVARLVLAGGEMPRLVMEMCSDVLDNHTGKGKVELEEVDAFLKKQREAKVSNKFSNGVLVPNNVPSNISATDAKRLGLSSEQEKICALLDGQPRTGQEITALLGYPKEKYNLVTAQLSKLVKKGKVVKTRRPSDNKVGYDLEEKFRFQRIRDAK